MARCSFKMPEEFLLKYLTWRIKLMKLFQGFKRRCGVVKDKVKSNLEAVIGKNTKVESRSTGELIKALGVSPAGIDRNGNHDVKVGFDEPRQDGVSNAKIANIIEYGKSGQPLNLS